MNTPLANLIRPTSLDFVVGQNHILGKEKEESLIIDELQYNFLPEHKKIPEGYRMRDDGLILREDVVDANYVQEIYISPRNFLFQMNKLTDERVIQEQKEENDTLPVTLDLIERGVEEYDSKRALVLEQGRLNYNEITDLEMCNLIDKVILPRYLNSNEGSIYDLPVSKRRDIGNAIWMEHRDYYGLKGDSILCKKKTNSAQIRRCLALNQ